MTDLSTSEAFDLAVAQKSRLAGIPWACAVCGKAGILEWDNDTKLLDLMFNARQQHSGASIDCTGNPLVIKTALVFRRCR